MKLSIPLPDQSLRSALQHKIDNKTKPLGALGMLENLALQLGLIQQTLKPQLKQPNLLIFAGDHGIADAGVSPYPQSVTSQMVLNFLNGGAAINVFAAQNGLQLKVIDSGVNHHFSAHPALIDAKVALGTRNFLLEPAMTAEQCESAVSRGAVIVDAEIANGCNVFGFGEMGIGNTSAASCLMSVLCGLPVAQCVGRGTGLDDAGFANKIKVLSQALAHHCLNADDAMCVLTTFGGFEIAMMVGAMLRAAEQGCVLLIDGFITTAALLVAAKLQPNILHYSVFTHCSDEAGHKAMLDFLGVKALLNMNLRLGEGSGAALAYPMVLAAVNFMNHMASFESASVSKQTKGR